MSAVIRYAALAFLAGVLASAQVASGIITGIVHDSSGGAVAGAQITLK